MHIIRERRIHVLVFNVLIPKKKKKSIKRLEPELAESSQHFQKVPMNKVIDKRRQIAIFTLFSRCVSGGVGG